MNRDHSLSSVGSVVLAPDCIPLFVVIVQNLEDLRFISPELGLNDAQFLLQSPADIFVLGSDDFKSKVDSAGEVYVEELGEFSDHCKAKLVNLECFQLLSSLEDRVELLKFIAIFEQL